MDIYQHIIAEAGRLLWASGPAAMTMDSVARNCGMSKRTLYEHFTDKRTLIKACLEAEHHRQEEKFRAIFDTADNCFDALFRTYLMVRDDMQRVTMTHIEEIKRMYPDLNNDQERDEKRFVHGLAEVLRKAQTEGHVITNLDTDIAAFLFFNTMRNLHKTERLTAYGLNRIEVFDAAFLNFLRGIATLDGITFIDRHVETLNLHSI